MTLKTISASDLPAIGAEFEGGIYIGRYIVGEGVRALTVLPDVLRGPWGEYGQEVSTGHLDGYRNTLSMAEAGSELAKQVLALGAHIPSVIEASLMYEAKRRGLIELDPHFHWTSSQYSADNAFYVDFEDGWVGYSAKGGERRVRPARRLLILQ